MSTRDDVVAAVVPIQSRIQRFKLGMALTWEHKSDHVEVRVKSGEGDDSRYGVQLFLDRDLPNIPPEGLESMVCGLLETHVDYCVRGDD